MKNPGIEDVITIDVATRDLRWAFENIIYEQQGRKPGLVGSFRDLVNIIRRIDNNSQRQVYK